MRKRAAFTLKPLVVVHNAYVLRFLFRDLLGLPISLSFVR